MKLWLLKTIEEGDYDEYHGFVIRARTYASARKIAQAEIWDTYSRDKGRWLDPARSSCQVIGTTTDDKEGVVLGDYHSG